MRMRRPSPLGGRRPRRAELAAFATVDSPAVDDLLPDPGCPLRMLIVGVNPGLWTAAVNAPFAHPGNRFWPSLHAAGLTRRRVDAAAGLLDSDAEDLLARGVGITNLVGRASAKASELTRDELRAGARSLINRLPELRPRSVAIAGITAFRQAFDLPRAVLGLQDPALVPGWPRSVRLWVVPQPSGLNAHENVESLAEKWLWVWDDSAQDSVADSESPG